MQLKRLSHQLRTRIKIFARRSGRVLTDNVSVTARMVRISHLKSTIMIQALLTILLHIRTTTAFSPSTLTLPLSINASSDENLTAQINRVKCQRDTDLRPLSDFSTCIPSLFSLYATPRSHTMIVWDPNDFKLWAPETDYGGCYILLDGGLQRDVFSVESLLGPAIWAVSKCFVGNMGGRNNLARTKVGPSKTWCLSVGLERQGEGSNGSLS